MNTPPRNDVTPDELRQEMVDLGLSTEGVNFELLAQHQNAGERDIPGWQAPRVLPPDWHEIDRDNAGGARYGNVTRKLRAILSCSIEADGRAWLHFSLSHRERVPTHGEMKVAKQIFLGDRYAYAVWPPAHRYVNLHPNVLHLFALLDEKTPQPLPDFTGATGSL